MYLHNIFISILHRNMTIIIMEIEDFSLCLTFVLRLKTRFLDCHFSSKDCLIIIILVERGPLLKIYLLKAAILTLVRCFSDPAGSCSFHKIGSPYGRPSNASSSRRLLLQNHSAPSAIYSGSRL